MSHSVNRYEKSDNKDHQLIKAIGLNALKLENIPDDFDPLIQNCISDDTQVVMIGEASHGTQEFYQLRAEITKRLITEKGFSIVAMEADWPDAYRVNRYVRTNFKTRDKTAAKALGSFTRFPTWMWRNTVTTEFIDWLRNHNTNLHNESRECGFYGLDIYSVQNSRDEVIKYLEMVDSELAERAKRYYGCFERFSNDVDAYSYKTGLGLASDCERAVIKVLNEMLARQAELMTVEDVPEDDAYFFARTNARVVANAECYYRNMIGGDNTWNIRDESMFETLIDLIEYLSEKTDQKKKVVIWAHNSHIGDASETEVKDQGEVNLGQLIRQHFGLDKSLNIGFTSYSGTVTAASKWDGEAEFKRLNKGLDGSFEKLFHQVVQSSQFDNQFMLLFRGNTTEADSGGKKKEGSATPVQYIASTEVINQLAMKRIERAVGVIYSPSSERQSHYFECKLSKQFDILIHVDETSALIPLEMRSEWARERKKTEGIPSAYPGLKDPEKMAERKEKMEGEGYKNPYGLDFA